MDGGGIDVWRGSLPEAPIGGAIVTIDLFKRDAEVKLLLGCTADETAIILDFLSSHSMGCLLVLRRDGARQGATE